MKNVKKVVMNLLKPNMHNLLVLGLIVFILTDVNVPHDVQNMMNEPIIKILLLTGALYLTIKQPLIGCLCLVVLYEILTRQPQILGPIGKSMDEQKDHIMQKFEENKKKVTLEEEVLQNIVPYYPNTEEHTSVEPILTSKLDSSDL